MILLSASAVSPSIVASPPENQESPVRMRQTACGDYHNLGLDSQAGQLNYPAQSFLKFSVRMLRNGT